MNKYTRKNTKNLKKSAKRIESSEEFLRHSERLDKLFAEAKIDPRYRDLLSRILSREVTQEKQDTRDYNIKFIREADDQTIDFMDAGVKNDFSPGESILFHGTVASSQGIDWILTSLKEALQKKDYLSFPFSPEVSNDLRTKYLLRTEPTDTDKSIISALKLILRKFISSEEEYSVLFSAISAAEKRFEKTEVEFVSPLEGGVCGKTRSLSKKEKEDLGLSEDKEVVLDQRKDMHDLVSLKELLRVCQGEEPEVTSIFAGAFNKYLPELESLGYRGVVFWVSQKRLKEIKLIKKSKDSVPFGPVESAATLISFLEEKENQFLSDDRFYVSVSGFVAASMSKNRGYGYRHIYLNNFESVKSAETFLYQKDESNETLCTRLYFYPYNPTEIHPLFQTHSVIYGSSDHTFNSCAKRSNDFINEEVKNKFMDLVRNKGYDAEPAVAIARKIFVGESSSAESMLQSKENIFDCVTNSLFGENRFTVDKFLYFMELSTLMSEEARKIKELKLLNNFYPLTSRFVVFNYITDKNGGLTKDPQLTTFRRLKRYNFQEVLNDITHGLKVVNGLSMVNDLIEKGINLQDAWSQSFDEETKKRMDKK
jgi:hypothetical protein